MNDQEIKKAFEEYRKRARRNEVIGALTERGLSASFAERAADGKWKPTRIHHRTRDVILKLLGLDEAS